MRKKMRMLAAFVAIILIILVAYYVYEALREPTIPEKLAHIIHLEDQRQPASRLAPYLNDDSDEVRSKAALAIGRIGGVGSVKLLFNLLGDKSLDIARMAAFSIGITGETDYAPILDERADRLPSSVAAAAIRSIGRLADSTMSELPNSFLRFLIDPSPEVREAVCYALFYAGAKKQSEYLIAFVLSEKDTEVKKAALFTLARLEVEKAISVYPRFQADSDPAIRILAVRGLGTGMGEGTIRLIAMSLNDKDKRVVSQAIASLQKIGGKEAVQYLASFLKNARDEKLIVQTIDALRTLDSGAGEEMALIHLRSDLSENFTVSAIKYLSSIKKERSVVLIDSLLAVEPTPRVKAACAEAFGLIGHKSVLPRLSTLFSDEDPMVRGAAFEELIKLDSTNRAYYIDKALGDQDPMPVVLAINQIESKGLTKYIPKLTKLIMQGIDIDVDIRRSVVSVASTFISNSDSNTVDSTYVNLLALGIMDDNYIVRQDAATAYRDLLGREEGVKAAPAKTRISESDLVKAIKRYDRNPTAVIVTEKGEIELELYFDTAPLTVLNFIELSSDGFYNGLIFHRVIPNFVAQGGDPRGDGWGGPPYFIRCEYSDEPYLTGTVGMATSGKDTGGSQFFITHSPQPHLEARYTVFGQVTGGMEIADLLVVGDIIEQIYIR